MLSQAEQAGGRTIAAATAWILIGSGPACVQPSLPRRGVLSAAVIRRWRSWISPPPFTPSIGAVVKGIDLAHPLVVAHPDTGRKLLFCNSAFTTHIVDLSKTESKAILEMLSCTRQTTQSFIVGCSGSQAR